MKQEAKKTGWFPKVLGLFTNGSKESSGFSNKGPETQVFYSWDENTKIRAFESLTFLSIINFIAMQFTEGDLVIKKYDYETYQWNQVNLPVTRKLMRFLRHPNKDVGKFAHDYSILYNYFAKGVALNKIEFSDTLQPMNFLSIDSDDVSFIYTPQGKLDEIRVRGNTPRSKDEFIIYRKGLDNRNLSIGMGSEKYGPKGLALDKESLNLAYYLTKQLGVQIPLISPKDGLEFVDTDSDEIKQIYKENTTGMNRGNPMVSPYPIDLKMIGARIMDLETKNLFYSCVQKVCCQFPIDPVVLGLGEANSVYNANLSARDMVIETLIIPLQSILNGQLGEQLLPFFFEDWQDYKIETNYTNVISVLKQKNTLIGAVSEGYKTKVFDRLVAKQLLGVPFSEEDKDVYFTINQVQILDGQNPDLQGKKLLDAKTPPTNR